MKKIELSKRLKTAADMMTIGKHVVDVGCDHAYTSIYLASEGIAESVIAADLRPGPLEIAKKNIELYEADERVEIRLSDGFEKIEPGETDAAIITGMGGLLIVGIMERGKKLSLPGYEMVISPQSEVSEVRKYLRENAWKTLDEAFLEDQGKYYNILKIVKLDETGAPHLPEEQEVLDRYGEILLQRKNESLKEQLLHEIESKTEIIQKLGQTDTESARVRREVLKEDIHYANLALALYE